MDQYDWQKNKAIVDRLYYTERVWETSVFFATCFTATNLLFIRKNYFANMARSRLAPTWLYTIGFCSFVTFVMMKPLRKEEIAVQTRKRFSMGKWLYSTYHLDEDLKYTSFRLF